MKPTSPQLKPLKLISFVEKILIYQDESVIFEWRWDRDNSMEAFEMTLDEGIKIRISPISSEEKVVGFTLEEFRDGKFISILNSAEMILRKKGNELICPHPVLDQWHRSGLVVWREALEMKAFREREGRREILEVLERKVGANWEQLGWKLEMIPEPEWKGTGEWRAKYSGLNLSLVELRNMLVGSLSMRWCSAEEAEPNEQYQFGAWEKWQGDSCIDEMAEGIHQWNGKKLTFKSKSEVCGQFVDGVRNASKLVGKWAEVMRHFPMQPKDSLNLIWGWRVGKVWIGLEEMRELEADHAPNLGEIGAEDMVNMLIVFTSMDQMEAALEKKIPGWDDLGWELEQVELGVWEAVLGDRRLRLADVEALEDGIQEEEEEEEEEEKIIQTQQEALREKIGENWKELGWKYAGDGSSRVVWEGYRFELFYEEGLDRLGKDKLRNLAIGTWHIDWDVVNGEWGFKIGNQEIALSLGAYFWDGNKVIDCSYDMIQGIVRTFNLALKQVKSVEWHGSVELESVLEKFSFEKVGEEWGWRVGEKWLKPEEMQSLVEVCATGDLRDKSVEEIVSFMVEAAGRVDFSAWNYLKLVQLEKLMDQKLGEDWSGWKLYSDKAGNHWAAFDENFKLSYQELSEMVIGNMSIRWNLELGKWTTYFGETALEPKSGYWLHQLGKLWSLEEFHLDSGILLATWNKAKFLEGNLNWAEFLRNFTWEVEHPHLGFWRIGDYRLTFGELETLKARIMDQLGILSRAELMEEMERGAAEIWKGHGFGEILDRLRWPLMSWMVNGDRLQGPEGAWLTLAEARELHLGNAEEKIEKAILRARKSQKMAQTMDLVKQKLGKRFNREAWMVSEDGEQIKFTKGEGMKFSVPEFEALGKQMLYEKIIQTQQIEMVEVLREKIGENWGECGWTVNLNEEGEAWANFEGEKLRGGFSLAGLKMLLGRENSLRWSESNRGWQSWNDQILIGGSGTSEKSQSYEWNVWNRELRLTEPGELGRRFAAGRTMARRIVEEPWVSIWQHFDLDEEPDGVADQSGCLNWGWIIEGNWLSWSEVQLIMAGAEWQALFLKQGINGVVNGLKDHYRKLIEARFAPWHELNRILDEFFPNWEELGWSRKMSEDPPGAWMEDPYGLRVTMEEMAAMGIGASKIVDESNQKELNMNLESSMEFPEVEPRVVMERALEERIPNWKELGWTIKELEGKTLACPPEGSANPDTTLSYDDVQALFTGNLQWRWNEGGAWETWVGAHSLNGLEKFYWARKSGMIGRRSVDVFEGGMEVLKKIEEIEGMKVWAPLMRHFALEEEMGRGWGWRIGDVWIEAGKIKHFVAEHLGCVNWNMESLVGALKNWANQVSGKNKILHELKKKIGENWAELGWSLRQNLGTGQWMAHFGELVLGKLELDRMAGKVFGHFHPSLGGWALYLNDSPRGDVKELEDLESRYYWIGGKLVWVGAGEEITSGEGCPLEFPEDGKWSELLAGYSVELRWDSQWKQLVWEWKIGDVWVTLDEMEEIRDCFLTEEILNEWELDRQRERLEQLALACLEDRKLHSVLERNEEHPRCGMDWMGWSFGSSEDGLEKMVVSMVSDLELGVEEALRAAKDVAALAELADAAGLEKEWELHVSHSDGSAILLRRSEEAESEDWQQLTKKEVLKMIDQEIEALEKKLEPSSKVELLEEYLWNGKQVSKELHFDLEALSDRARKFGLLEDGWKVELVDGEAVVRFAGDWNIDLILSDLGKMQNYEGPSVGVLWASVKYAGDSVGSGEWRWHDGAGRLVWDRDQKVLHQLGIGNGGLIQKGAGQLWESLNNGESKFRNFDLGELGQFLGLPTGWRVEFIFRNGDLVTELLNPLSGERWNWEEVVDWVVQDELGVWCTGRDEEGIGYTGKTRYNKGLAQWELGWFWKGAQVSEENYRKLEQLQWDLTALNLGPDWRVGIMPSQSPGVMTPTGLFLGAETMKHLNQHPLVWQLNEDFWPYPILEEGTNRWVWNSQNQSLSSYQWLDNDDSSKTFQWRHYLKEHSMVRNINQKELSQLQAVFQKYGLKRGQSIAPGVLEGTWQIGEVMIDLGNIVVGNLIDGSYFNPGGELLHGKAYDGLEGELVEGWFWHGKMMSEDQYRDCQELEAIAKKLGGFLDSGWKVGQASLIHSDGGVIELKEARKLKVWDGRLISIKCSLDYHWYWEMNHDYDWYWDGKQIHRRQRINEDSPIATVREFVWNPAEKNPEYVMHTHTCDLTGIGEFFSLNETNWNLRQVGEKMEWFLAPEAGDEIALSEIIEKWVGMQETDGKKIWCLWKDRKHGKGFTGVARTSELELAPGAVGKYFWNGRLVEEEDYEKCVEIARVLSEMGLHGWRVEINPDTFEPEAAFGLDVSFCLESLRKLNVVPGWVGIWKDGKLCLDGLEQDEDGDVLIWDSVAEQYLFLENGSSELVWNDGKDVKYGRETWQDSGDGFLDFPGRCEEFGTEARLIWQDGKFGWMIADEEFWTVDRIKNGEWDLEAARKRMAQRQEKDTLEVPALPIHGNLDYSGMARKITTPYTGYKELIQELLDGGWNHVPAGGGLEERWILGPAVIELSQLPLVVLGSMKLMLVDDTFEWSILDGEKWRIIKDDEIVWDQNEKIFGKRVPDDLIVQFASHASVESMDFLKNPNVMNLLPADFKVQLVKNGWIWSSDTWGESGTMDDWAARMVKMQLDHYLAYMKRRGLDSFELNLEDPATPKFKCGIAELSLDDYTNFTTVGEVKYVWNYETKIIDFLVKLTGWNAFKPWKESVSFNSNGESWIFDEKANKLRKLNGFGDGIFETNANEIQNETNWPLATHLQILQDRGALIGALDLDSEVPAVKVNGLWHNRAELEKLVKDALELENSKAKLNDLASKLGKDWSINLEDNLLVYRKENFSACFSVEQAEKFLNYELVGRMKGSEPIVWTWTHRTNPTDIGELASGREYRWDPVEEKLVVGEYSPLGVLLDRSEQIIPKAVEWDNYWKNVIQIDLKRLFPELTWVLRGTPDCNEVAWEKIPELKIPRNRVNISKSDHVRLINGIKVEFKDDFSTWRPCKYKYLYSIDQTNQTITKLEMNVEGMLHCLAGPAMQTYHVDGKSREDRYFINGKELNMEDYQIEKDQIELQEIAQKLSGTVIGIGKDSRILLGGSRLSLEEARKVNRCDLVATLDSNRKWIWKEEKIVDRTNYPPANDSGQGSSENLADGRYINYNVNSKEYLIRTRKNGIATASSDFSANWWWSQPKAQELLNRLGSLPLQLHSGKSGDDYLSTVRLTINGINFDFHTAENIFSSPLKQEERFGWGWFVDGDVLGYGHMEEHGVDGLTNIYFTNEDGKHERKDVWYWRGERVPSQEDYHARKKTQATIDRLHEIAKILGPDRWTVDEVGMQLQSTDYHHICFSLEEAEKINSTIPLGEIKNGEIIWKFGKISSFPKLFESEMDEVKKEALANGKWWYCAYNAKPWYYFRNHGAFSDETSNTWKFWSKEWGKSFLGAWGHLPWRIEMNEGRCLDSDKYSERVDLRLYGRVFTVDEARYIVDWDNPETLKNIDASQMHWGLRGDTWVGQRLSAQGPWRYVEEISVDGSKKEYWLNPHTQERLADSEYQQMVLKEKLSQDLKELAAKMESAGLTNLQDKLNTLTRELVVESKASDPTTKELQQEFDRLSQTIDSKHLILTSDSIKIKGFAYSLAEAKRINSVDMVGELNAEGELIWTAISKADGSKQLANERYRWIRKDGNTNQYATRDQGKTSRVPGEKSYVVGLASPARKGYQVLEKLKSSKIPFKFLVHQYDSEDRYDVEIYGQKLSLDEALGIKSSYLQKELNTEARNLIYEDECLKEFHVNKNHQYHRADGPAITCYGPNGEIKEYHWYNDKYYSDYQAWQREVARGKVVEMKLKAEKELERLGTGFYLVEDFVEEVDGKLRLEYLILHQYNGVKTFTLDEVETVNTYDLIGVIDAESKELVWKIRHRITKETSLADGIYWDAGPNYRSYSARENGQIVEYGDKKSRDLVVDFWKNGVGRDLIQKFKECSANLEIKCVPRYGITKTSDIELAYSWTFFGNYFTLSEVEKILLAGDWTAKYINGGEAHFHKKSNTALTGQHWFLSGSGSMLQHVSFDQNGIIHSEDGPAVINYSNSESFPTKLYYWNGKCISEKAWNEEKLEKAKLALEKIKQACKVEIARLNEFGFELKEVRAAEQVVDYQICHAHTGRLFSLEEAARINLYDQYAELKDGKFQWFTKNRLTGEAAIPIVDLEYLYCNSTKYQGIRFLAEDTSGFWFDGVGKQLLEKFEKLNVACRIITKDYLECDLNQRFRLEIAGVEFSIAEALKIQDQLNGVIHGRNVFFNYDKQLVIKERDENLALHSENGPACRVQDAKNSKTMTDTYYWHGELLHQNEWLKRKEAIALKAEVPWTPEWRAKLLNETSQVEVYFTSSAGSWITTGLPRSDGYPNGALVQIVKDGQRETFIHHQNKWLRHEASDKNDKGGTRVEYGEAIQNIADSNKNQNFFFGHKISRPKFDLNDDKRNGEFYGIDSNKNARRMFYTSWKDGRRHRVDGPALERFDEELRTVSAEYYLDGVEIPNSDWLTGRVIEKFDIYQGEWDKKTPEELTGNFWVWGHDYGPLHLGKVYPKEDFLTRFEIIDVKNKEYRYQVYQNGKPGDYTWVVNGTCFDSEDKYLASKKEEEKSKELTVQGRKLTPEQYASIKHLIDKKKDFTLLENGNGIAICGENLSWDQASQVKFGTLCYRTRAKSRETLSTANEEHVNGLPDGTHWYLASCLVKVIIQNGAMHNEAGPALRIYGENISDRYYVDGKRSTQKNLDKDVKSFKDSQIKDKFLEFLKGFSNYHQDGGDHCLGQLCLTDLETYEVAGKNDNVSGTKTVLSQDGREWFVCKYVEGKKTEQFYIRNDGLIIHSRWNNKDLHSSEEASISEQLPEKHEWKPSHYHLNGNPYTKARWEWLRHVNNRDLFGAQINGLILTGNQINCLDHNDPSCTFDPETQTLRIVENGSILIVKENGEQSRMDLSQILPATLVEEVAQELSVWEEAGYRVAAQQIGSKLCDFIQRQAPKTKKFLASPWGRALVYQALGWLLLAHPTWKHNPKILKLSAELRVEGLALAGEDLFTTLLEFFLDAQEEMREVKEIQYQAKNAPIEYEGNIGTPEMEEEVELLTEQVIS